MNECEICYDEKPMVIFRKCGHECCEDCYISSYKMNKKCPFCRGDMDKLCFQEISSLQPVESRPHVERVLSVVDQHPPILSNITASLIYICNNVCCEECCGCADMYDSHCDCNCNCDCIDKNDCNFLKILLILLFLTVVCIIVFVAAKEAESNSDEVFGVNNATLI